MAKATGARPSRIEFDWADRDEYPTLKGIVIAGMAAAVLFARFGLPDVPVMWPEHHLGLVFATCGVTRSVVALARLDPGRAWAFNPLGFGVAAIGLAVFVRAAIGSLRGRWLTVSTTVSSRIWVAALALGLAGLWAWQQAHAGFIIHHAR